MLGRIIALLILVALAGLVVWEYNAGNDALRKRQQQQQDAAAAQVSQVQQQCEDSALARFRVLGLDGHPGATHKGHFNPGLNKCYELIEDRHSATGTDWRNVTLYDADGKVFASYGWHSDSDSSSATISPYTCTVTVPSGQFRDCASETEFTSLIAAYMK